MNPLHLSPDRDLASQVNETQDGTDGKYNDTGYERIEPNRNHRRGQCGDELEREHDYGAQETLELRIDGVHVLCAPGLREHQ